VWVSPHAEPDGVLAVLRELHVDSASVLRGRESGGRPMVDAWDLAAGRVTDRTEDRR
jgi:hypothetical protein